MLLDVVDLNFLPLRCPPIGVASNLFQIGLGSKSFLFNWEIMSVCESVLTFIQPGQMILAALCQSPDHILSIPVTETQEMCC